MKIAIMVHTIPKGGERMQTGAEGARPEAYIDYLVHFHADRDWFECHEILEEYWKKNPDDPRGRTWVALIQTAVALYHHRRGNAAGALKMVSAALRNASDRDLASLGIDDVAFRHALDERRAELASEEKRPFRDLDIPLADPALLKRCLRRCEELGLVWGRPSDLNDDFLCNKHMRRDRREVIENRLRAYERRRGAADEPPRTLPMKQTERGTSSMSKLLEEIISYNRAFVEQKQYEPYLTSKFPDRKFVILTCMDTRLIELLPASMNIRNGDVKMIKSAGAVVSSAFGGIMRSIIVAVYELGAEEVFVIGHHDCGMSAMNPQRMREKFMERGVRTETLEILEHSGLDIQRWLRGFDDVNESVRSSVRLIRNHPLMPKLPVHGLVIDPKTGKLDVVDAGYPIRVEA